MKIAVASGKGGTGKTTVAVNLALSLDNAKLLDCDVEEPNAHTLLNSGPEKVTSVTTLVPLVNQDKCTLCKECADFCEFNAIFVGKSVMVYEQMCHSCGGCALVCPDDAIQEVNREVGNIHEVPVDCIRLVYGTLNIGEPIATTLIRKVKSFAESDAITILDAPPGTACPVIETMQECDYLILVTEPTPFGMHDLSMAVDVVQTLNIPFGVIINRAGLGDYDARGECEKIGVPVIMEIPFDRRIAELYSSGIPFVKEMPEWREKFRELHAHIEEIVDND